MHAADATRTGLEDIARMWQYAREHDVAAQIKRLHRPMMLRSLTATFADWAIVFAAFAAVRACGLPVTPLAIVIIGNRQRALGNLLHDAAHGSFGRDRRYADLAACWLLFRPMWNSLEIYRRDHFAHHRLLGAPGCDVDLIHSEQDMDQPWLALLWKHVANRQTWKGSTLGHLLRVEPGELGLMVSWWVGLLMALALLIGPIAAVEFATLWLVSRATAFHLITTFREISDHVGLRPGTLIGFSRNHTQRGLFAMLFYPHNNGYHLVHHLNPGMPYFALPRAHALLLAWPEYATATHSRRYFCGEAALVRSWVRALPPARQKPYGADDRAAAMLQVDRPDAGVDWDLASRSEVHPCAR